MGQRTEGEISISGMLVMLDDRTPHLACVVQAVMPARQRPAYGNCIDRWSR
jgi:hypothetical protein